MSDFQQNANKVKENFNKAVEVATNYDYKEKAKDVAENIKNFDYKGEAENIKQGGIKYFWDKYKKAVIVGITSILLLIIVINLFGDGITETTNGNRHFSMTKDEFSQDYNDLYYELTESDLYDPDEYPRLNEEYCVVFTPSAAEIEEYPHMTTIYEYDTTLYASGITETKNSTLAVETDDNENIIAIIVSRGSSALQTQTALESYILTDCAAALSIIADMDMEDAKRAMDKVAAGSGVGEEGNCQYLFNESNGKTSCIIRVNNQ